jgi:lipopolysaccharide heptosyltransferase II
MTKEVQKILFVTLSNIGDAILTLPGLDLLRRQFPQARFTVVTGPRNKEIFEGYPQLERVIVYDKHSGRMEKGRLLRELRKERFDMVIDLRNSLFQAWVPAGKRTSFLTVFPKGMRHMKERHLYRVLKAMKQSFAAALEREKPSFPWISPQDEAYVDTLLSQNCINRDDRVIVVAAGARSSTKRWPKENFARLVSLLEEFPGVKIILVGDKADAQTNQYIRENSAGKALDLSGQTGMAKLASLFKRSRLVITNDSACLHLASYLDVPVVTIFGPTDESKYGPWSKVSSVVKKDIICRPCEKAQCHDGHLKCLHLINVEDVLRQVREILSMGTQSHKVTKSQSRPIKEFKRILITRTDRIGDVLLSTPVIQALRDAYPASYIAMMVSPYTKDIVEGNPYLDEVIIYDKDKKHKSWLSSARLAMALRKKKFDLALILHPTKRVHLMAFFAGISRRVGYDKDLGVLLTDRIKHVKQFGEKHESEYSLDLVRFLGVEAKENAPFLPVDPEAEAWAGQMLESCGVKKSDRLLVVHPGASCPSRIWPPERFAQVADRLIDKYGFKVFVVAGAKDRKLAEDFTKRLRHPAVNLAGAVSLKQLASLLRRAYLFISSDSGPMHMAASLGVPLVCLFSRNEPGLSKTRWGPQGHRNRVLHKQVGCVKCLAHDCRKEFACLKAISVEDVLEAVDSLMES